MGENAWGKIKEEQYFNTYGIFCEGNDDYHLWTGFCIKKFWNSN
jgi:hypothetical protein